MSSVTDIAKNWVELQELNYVFMVLHGLKWFKTTTIILERTIKSLRNPDVYPGSGNF